MTYPYLKQLITLDDQSLVSLYDVLLASIGIRVSVLPRLMILR